MKIFFLFFVHVDERKKEIDYFLSSYKLFITPRTLLQLLLARISRDQYKNDSPQSNVIRHRFVGFLLIL